MLHQAAEQFKPLTPPASTCLVAELGRHSAWVAVQIDAIEKQGPPSGSREERKGYHMLTSLAAAAAFKQTVSAEGALFQIAIACQAAHQMFDYCTTEEDSAAEEYVDKARAALYSVRSFLEAHFHLDANKVGAEALMPREHGPIGFFENKVREAASASAAEQAAA